MSRVKSSIPVSVGQRSKRDMSGRSFGTTDFGRLDVLYHTELVPNDDFSFSVNGLLRGATMVAPTLGKMYYDVRAFFVPYRILTHRPEEGKSNFVWDYFINRLSNTTHPFLNYFNLSGALLSFAGDKQSDARRLLSQLRLPSVLYNVTSSDRNSWPQSGNSIGFTNVNPWPYMTYQRIWWDFYRDKTQIDESLLSTYLPFPGTNLVSQNDCAKYITPRYACWPKDYFTNARPMPTDGGITPSVPLTNYQALAQEGALRPYVDNIGTGSQNVIALKNEQLSAGVLDVDIDNQEVAYWSMQTAAIRMAKLVDDYLQRLNIAGTSISDRVFARFGIRPQERVVNNAQYIGGFRHDFSTGEVLSNIETGSLDPEGVNNAFNYGGSGTQAGQSTGSIYTRFDSKEFMYHAKEYGTFMIIGTLVPYTGYFQGLHRGLQHGCSTDINESRFSYLTPELANDGLQPIKRKEIYGSQTQISLYDDVFGFSERYGEYAYQPDVVDSDIVLTATKSGMNALHLFREFSSNPSLSASFTQIDPSARGALDRIFNYLRTGSQETLLDHFQRVVYVTATKDTCLASSMLPDLFENNNHGNVVSVDVGGSRF